MAAVLAECFGEKCSQGFACAIIVWYTALGFLIGYLTTRIYLSYVFSIADQKARRRLADRLDFLIDKKVHEKTETVLQGKAESLLQGKAESFSAITEGLAALARTVTDPQIWTSAIEKLENVLASDPADARAAVVLGRLYRWKRNDLGKALEILTHTAEKMKESGLPVKNYANVLYNRACYNILLAKDEHDAAKRQVFFSQHNVKEDLRLALENSPETLVPLSRTDSDLDSVRGEPWFGEFLARFQSGPGQTVPPGPGGSSPSTPSSSAPAPAALPPTASKPAPPPPSSS